MIAIFEVGTLWFWVFVAIVSCGLMAVQEKADSPGGWTTFLVILTFVGLYYLGAGVSMKELGLHIIHHPMETLVYFLLYTLVGVVWSFYKWGRIVNTQATKYKEKLKSYGKANLPDYRPDLGDYKGEIFNWIFYWPFSFSWFVIHEPIERLFDIIMKNTKKVYEGITNKAFKIAENDMVHK